MAQRFDFDDFIDRMANLDSGLEIIKRAESECEWLLRNKTKDRENFRQAERVKAFLWFMRTGTKPGSATPDEFASYKRVVQSLVDKGAADPDWLKLFG